VTRYVAIVALLACLGLCGALWLQSGRVDRLTAQKDLAEGNLAILEAREKQAVEDLAEASANAAKDRARVAAMRAQVETVLTTNYGGCADAPIDPAVLDDIGELRRSGR